MSPALSAQDSSPGIVVERHRASRAPDVEAGDRTITIVRVDLRRYDFRFLTEADGPARPLDAWVRDFHLAGGINAGMFLPSGRPCGYMRLRGEVLSSRSPSSFRAVIGFDPTGRAPAFGVGGTGCSRDLAGMQGAYRSVLQANRVLVDCDGHAITEWHTGRYSSALIGADDAGRAVLVHVRTPYRMQHLAEMLEELDLGIRGLVYMEGGPEASVVVDAEGVRVSEMGSWEDGFHEADDLHELWDLPNVVAFAPHAP